MTTFWLKKGDVSNSFLVETVRAVEENLAAIVAKVGEGDVRAVAMVQEATLAFIREKLLESWDRGLERGCTECSDNAARN